MHAPFIHRCAIVAGIASTLSIGAFAEPDGLSVFVPGDFPNIQAALDALPMGGAETEIYLAPGIYHENIDVSGKNVAIIGDPIKPYTVTIDGLGDNSTVMLRTVPQSYAVTMIGVTITGGTGRVTSTPQLGHTYGGGVHLQDYTFLRMEDCVVRDNSAWYGGGIYANGDSRLELSDVLVSDNYAEYVGGGVNTLGDINIDGCTFDQNESFSGGHINAFHGVMFETVIQNSTFRNGFAVDRPLMLDAGYIAAGGAISFHSDNGDAVIRNCTFENNISTGQGGAIASIPFLLDELQACTSGENACPEGGLLVEDCSFTNCIASKGGGIAWYQRGGLTANRLTFDTCVATNGGGVYTYLGEHSLRETSFVNCGTFPGGQGAAINCQSSTLELFDSSLEVCMAHEGSGGGIALEDSTLDMRDCLLRGNESELPGSALYALRSSVRDQRSEIINHVTSTAVFLDMESSTFSAEFIRTLFQRNGYYAAAGESQGAVYLHRERGEEGSYQPRCRFADCTFDRNESAVNGGGAIRSHGMDVEIKVGDFVSNNTLSGIAHGGAIHVHGASVEITDTNFDRNIASGHGGAIYIENTLLEVMQSVFTSNYAEGYGGSIESTAASRLGVLDCSFVGGASVSAVYGGAIDIDKMAGEAAIISSSISGCSADIGGGGIYSDGPDTRYLWCRIQGNSAEVGGGVCTTFGAGLIEESRICGNTVGQIMGDYEDGGGNVIAEHCCDGDLNGDGQVDGADLTILLAAWGTSNGMYDINQDGTVDGADLTVLLAAWGDCN